MRLGFTGTQIGCTHMQFAALTELLMTTLRHNDEFHHGDCVGADEQAHGIARLCGAVIHIHPPTNATKRAHCDGNVIWPPRPYLDRNQDVVMRTERMIACPKGPEERRSGTGSTVRYARRHGRPVTIVWPDGSIEG